MRKPDFCLCKNKDADQLCSNCTADQHLCFHYTDSTIPLLSKFKISSLWPSSVILQAGLCRTWSETKLWFFSCLNHFCSPFQALITKHTFSQLPPSYQYKLICLMPECDKIVGKDGALRYVKLFLYTCSLCILD